MPCADFTSAGYLGYRHGHDQLRPWRWLSTSRPPVLGESRQATALAAELARRAGRASGVLETSALHAFVDCWSVLSTEPVLPLIDEAAYSLGRIGSRANGLRGTTVRHFDPDHLSDMLRSPRGRRRPVLLVDGLCPGCGRLAPLDRLVAALAPRGGLVLVDDTQAIGVAGARPSPAEPYGAGGGGTAARLGIPPSAPVLVVASTAKAYGVPLAVVAGPAGLVSRVRRDGPNRTHASGPTAAVTAALTAALADPRDNAQRRRTVAELVMRFRSALRRHGLPPPDGAGWPMQAVPIPTGSGSAVRAGLLRHGVRAVVVRRRCRPGIGVAFLITAGHTPEQIDRAAGALADVLATPSNRAAS